jgi:hypothetical protein
VKRSEKVADYEEPVHLEIFEKLSQAIEEWENSPYLWKQEELFDLERFLLDQDAEDLKKELERIYGTPLNQKFWSSSLAYHRLKRAWEAIKAQDAIQEEKRRQYLEAVAALEGENQAVRAELKELFHQQQRQMMRVIPGGRKDGSGDSRK